MLKIRYVLFIVLLGMPLYSVASSAAQDVSIGIDLQVYPELVVVPGYPVYYAPREETNFFFYDGMYWVYQNDNWYESSWYNGPWWLMDPEDVPEFVLRVPVGYYRQPPVYFRGWQSDAPPRWGEHWGGDWEQRRSGWDRWDRSAAPPAPAPLPVYQRQYSGNRYPQQVKQQHELQKQNYRYQPRDPVVRQHYQKQAVQRAPAQQVQPQQVKPQQVQPQQVKPQQIKPQQIKPQQIKPQQVKPQQVKPQQVKPQQVQPQQVKPQQVKPRQEKPQQVKPRQEKPQQEKQGAPEERF